MQTYKAWLESEGYKVKLLMHKEILPKLNGVHCMDVHDDWLKQKLEKTYSNITWHPYPGFITKTPLKKAAHYRMSSFYIQQRKDLNILIDGEEKPEGGKWSFDTENRKKLPKDFAVPHTLALHSNTSKELIEEAKKWVEENFAKNPGDTQQFLTPISHEDAEKWLEEFLNERFEFFGDYEDAIDPRHDVLFHSLLSPLINVGLLTPMQCIEAILKHAKQHKVPINALEGLVRQIIGWREFVNQVYHLEGRRQRTKNFFKHFRTIPAAFWTGNTGIPPIDDSIKKVTRTAYAHHIERLMIISNFMNLCEFDPDEIYEWFMALFIDAYDWVMVPNVYGMSLYADGGLMTTKPYISSSNYIRKMSSYKNGDWCNVWDGLYWRFINKHKDFFAGNPRLSVMTLALRRMSDEKLNEHLENAENFLKTLDA